ncbi:MAG: PAS domain S-box protein [Candidatus Hydrogenedentes bacterium]|nr:PAS domain S-box protein [Candidatus Hydrogenedentota bacterium]
MIDRLPPPLRYLTEFLRPSYDGPVTWLWFVGSSRIALLVIVVLGTQLLTARDGLSVVLVGIYLGALASSLWYLIAVSRQQRVIPPVLTWTQVLVDFSVVAVTISYTDGQSSYFTFLLVIVILEAGVLMGLIQGFVFATLSTAFMFFQALWSIPHEPDPLLLWYNFLIQGIAFFFTAFISGYWNQRVSRMKQFQREILDNMNSGFLITDDKGIVVAINHSACAILNLKESNVAGLHVDGVMRPDSATECPVTTALRSGRDFTSYEFYAETGGTAPKLLGLTTNRISDSHGHVTGLIASFVDLTEMARMRGELQRQDRMAAIGELSAGLAHEIRNPVASIRGAMEELAVNLEHPDMIPRLARIAIRESDHLNEIVTGFLDFAKKPSRGYELVELRTLLHDVKAKMMRLFGESGNLRINLDLPGRPCEVLGDGTKIHQVFDNLAQNAIEAMGSQGALEMRVVQHADGGPVEIHFEDTGPGIAPDKVARIFEPFYTEKPSGVGMGLAICMRIITAHDGIIQVASRPGGGTAMIVRLPQAPRGLNAAQEGAAPAGRG